MTNGRILIVHKDFGRADGNNVTQFPDKLLVTEH